MRIPALGAFGLALLAGCPGQPEGGAKQPTGQEVCEDKRRSLDCDSEVRYAGVKTEGSAHVLNIPAGNAAIADTALRQLNAKVEETVAGHLAACRQHNACTLTAAAYQAQASQARARLAGVAALVDKVNAGDARGRATAADELVSTVSGTKSGPPLSISVTLDAELPQSVGGGKRVIAPNYPLPTNSKVSFNFSVSQSAHVYLFQVDASKKVSVLFPDDRIATRNPLPAGRAVQIPENGLRFRVDEKGIGTENVYFVASVRPLAALEQTLKRFASGQVQEVRQDPLMADIAALQGAPSGECARTRDLSLVADEPPPRAGAGGGCPKTRGLVLDAAPEANQTASHSLEARAAAGDDVIVKFFPFQHVEEAQFASKLAEYNAPTPSGVKTRGIVIEPDGVMVPPQ